MIHMNKFIGYLLLNSKEYKHSNKQGFTKKKFIPFYSVLPGPFWVNIKISKVNNQVNQFAVINCHKNNNDEIEYSIDQYINTDELSTKIAICHWHNINYVNSDKYQLNKSIADHDLTPNRICLDDVYSISVDPIGSTDIDDAIGIRQINESLFDIYIHIADPTSYLIEKSWLDVEVSNRIESVYFSDKTYHMFPQNLVQDLFSLNAESIRRAYSVIISISINESNDDFCVTKYCAQKSTVKIKHNYSYDDVDDIVSKINNPTIIKLYDIGKLVYTKYTKNDLIKYDSKKMIEGYMIMCNHLVAKLMLATSAHNDVLLRVQSENGPEISYSSIDHEYINIHNNLQRKSAKFVAYKHENTNTEHASLHLDMYTNFTSPIRRYSDIIVHRLLYNLYSQEANVNNYTISDEILFKMNYYKQLYKKTSKYNQIMSIYDALCVDGLEDIIFELNGIIVDIKYNSKRDIILKIFAKHIFNDNVSQNIKSKIINNIHTIKLIDNLLLKSQSPDYVISCDTNSNIQCIDILKKKYRMFDECSYNLCIFKNAFYKFIAYFPLNRI